MKLKNFLFQDLKYIKDNIDFLEIINFKENSNDIITIIDLYLSYGCTNHLDNIMYIFLYIEENCSKDYIERKLYGKLFLLKLFLKNVNWGRIRCGVINCVFSFLKKIVLLYF